MATHEALATRAGHWAGPYVEVDINIIDDSFASNQLHASNDRYRSVRGTSDVARRADSSIIRRVLRASQRRRSDVGGSVLVRSEITVRI
jgi:hypothetical protein